MLQSKKEQSKVHLQHGFSLIQASELGRCFVVLHWQECKDLLAEQIEVHVRVWIFWIGLRWLRLFTENNVHLTKTKRVPWPNITPENFTKTSQNIQQILMTTHIYSVSSQRTSSGSMAAMVSSRKRLAPWKHCTLRRMRGKSPSGGFAGIISARFFWVKYNLTKGLKKGRLNSKNNIRIDEVGKYLPEGLMGWFTLG